MRNLGQMFRFGVVWASPVFVASTYGKMRAQI